jgi:hypothetical protein
MIPLAVHLTKRLFAKARMSFGSKLSLACLIILLINFCPKLHPSFDKLGFEGEIANLNFIRVEGVVREVGKMLKKWWILLMKTMGKCAIEFLLLRSQVFVNLFLINLIIFQTNW